MTDSFSGIHRRSLLVGLGAAAFGASVLSKSANAQQEASGLSEASQTKEAMAGESMVFDKSLRGDFALDEPLGNFLATLKMTNNLVGERTYIPMMGRFYLGPQGKPGAPIHGLLGMWTWQLQRPDPKEYPNLPEHTVIQRAQYTGIMTDPNTFEPVERVYNHVLDQEVETRDSLFAESYLFYPNGTGSSLDRPAFMSTGDGLEGGTRNPHVRWGDQMSIYLAGLFQNEGPNQPRMDGSIWTGDAKRVMSRKSSLVPVDYNFAGLMRAWERPWIGFEKPDETQLLMNVKGTKLHSPDDFPEMIKKHLVAKYPERL